jgi:nucleotide-binding universal stress UspA family protein
MYDRILLPTDTSAGVQRAIDHAIHAAKRYETDIHFLLVVDKDVYSAYSGDEYVHELEGLESALEQAGQEELERLRERAAQDGLNVTTELRHGVPHEEILAYIDDADIDLTVMGSESRPGEYRQLIGSVTKRVTKLSRQPVTVVKTELEESG